MAIATFGRPGHRWRNGGGHWSHGILACSLFFGSASIWFVASTTQFEDIVVPVPDICLLQRALQTPIEMRSQEHLRCLVPLSLLERFQVEPACLLDEIVLLEVWLSLLDPCEFVALGIQFMVHPGHFQLSLLVQLLQVALEAILRQHLQYVLPGWDLRWASIQLGALVTARHLQLLRCQTLRPKLVHAWVGSGHAERFTARGWYAAHELIYLLPAFGFALNLSCSR